MTRRNLRKWAEAKQRRAAQAVAGIAGARPLLAWWDETPRFGTAVAPTTWLPMEPPAPYPYGPLPPVVHPHDREFFASLFGTPTTTNSTTYTHTLNYPPTEYDHNGYPLPPRIQPSMTITLLPPNNEDCNPSATFSRAIEMLMLHDLTPQEVAVTQSAFSRLVADYSAQTPGIGHVRHGQNGDWFHSLRWSPAAWQALHGADGPRTGRR